MYDIKTKKVPVTNEIGYEDACIFSPDGKKLVSRIASEDRREERNMDYVKQGSLRYRDGLFTCNIDGSDLKHLPAWEKQTGSVLSSHRQEIIFSSITKHAWIRIPCS